MNAVVFGFVVLSGTDVRRRQVDVRGATRTRPRESRRGSAPRCACRIMRTAAQLILALDDDRDLVSRARRLIGLVVVHDRQRRRRSPAPPVRCAMRLPGVPAAHGVDVDAVRPDPRRLARGSARGTIGCSLANCCCALWNWFGRREPGEHVDVAVVDDVRRDRDDVAEPFHRALVGADVGVEPVERGPLALAAGGSRRWPSMPARSAGAIRSRSAPAAAACSSHGPAPWRRPASRCCWTPILAGTSARAAASGCRNWLPRTMPSLGLSPKMMPSTLRW